MMLTQLLAMTLVASAPEVPELELVAVVQNRAKIRLTNKTRKKIAIDVVGAAGPDVRETSSCSGDGLRALRPGGSAELPPKRTHVVRGKVENVYIPSFFVWVLPGSVVTLTVPLESGTRRVAVPFVAEADMTCEPTNFGPKKGREIRSVEVDLPASADGGA